MILSRHSIAFVSLAVVLASVVNGAEYQVKSDDKTITIDTPQLQAVVKKTHYVTGSAAGSFLDKRSGFRDVGYGLDIVDWIMEPGSDVKQRDHRPHQLVHAHDTAR